MASGFAIDEYIKDKEDIDEHMFHPREVPPNTSLGKQYRNQQPYFRIDRYYDPSYVTSGGRPSEPAATVHHEPNLIKPSASYILSRAGHLESNVDHWIGNDSADHNDEVRPPRRDSAAQVHPSSLSSASSRAMAHLWSLLNSVDVIATYIKQVVSRARARVGQLAIDQIFNEFFAVGMDVVIALHVLIYLCMCAFQASTIESSSDWCC